MINAQTWEIYQSLARQIIPSNNDLGTYCNINTALLNHILAELNSQQQLSVNANVIADVNKTMQTLTNRIVDLDNRVKNLEQSVNDTTNLFGVC